MSLSECLLAALALVLFVCFFPSVNPSELLLCDFPGGRVLGAHLSFQLPVPVVSAEKLAAGLTVCSLELPPFVLFYCGRFGKSAACQVWV